MVEVEVAVGFLRAVRPRLEAGERLVKSTDLVGNEARKVRQKVARECLGVVYQESPGSPLVPEDNKVANLQRVTPSAGGIHLRGLRSGQVLLMKKLLIEEACENNRVVRVRR